MNKKEFILKLIASVAGSCLIVPIISLYAWIRKISVVSVLPKFYAGYIICTLIGFLAAFLIDKAAVKFKKSRIKFNTAAIFISPVWCIFAAKLLFQDNFLLTSLLYASAKPNDNNPVLFAICLTAIIYIAASIFGIRMYIRSEDKLLHQNNYLAVTITNLGCLFFVGFAKWQSQFDSAHEIITRPLDISFMVPVFLLYIIAYMIINNQTNISFVMDRRKNSHSSLPKSIRKFNFLLTAGICGVVFVLFLFRGLISQQLVGFMNLLKLIGLVFLWILMTIFNLFSFKAPDEASVAQKTEELLQNAIQSKDSTIQMILIYIVSIVCIIYMVWRYWQVIYKLFLKLTAFVKRIYNSLVNSSVNVSQAEASDYYYDSVEQIEPASYKENDNKAQLKESLKLKQAVKEYKKQQDPEKLITQGFKIIKAYFKLNGVKIAESDTAREIDKKVSESTFKIKTNDISQAYEQVKYNGETPTLQAAKQISTKINDIIK